MSCYDGIEVLQNNIWIETESYSALTTWHSLISPIHSNTIKSPAFQISAVDLIHKTSLSPCSTTTHSHSHIFQDRERLSLRRRFYRRSLGFWLWLDIRSSFTADSFFWLVDCRFENQWMIGSQFGLKSDDLAA